MEDTLEKYKEQHLNNYKNAILETIKNNTDVLINEDMMLLLKKPPLDSMDLIKVKCLDLAKKNKVLLDAVKIDNYLDKYRNMVIKCCDEIKELRITLLSKIVTNSKLENDYDIVKFNKKDFADIDRKIKKILKEQLISAMEKFISPNISNIIVGNVDSGIIDKISTDIIKYVKGPYQRQLLENLDFKILVKDTTLINVVKEQGERYLFTLNNSRIFQQEDI